jgi:hypothetical protein
MTQSSAALFVIAKGFRLAALLVSVTAISWAQSVMLTEYTILTPGRQPTSPTALLRIRVAGGRGANARVTQRTARGPMDTPRTMNRDLPQIGCSSCELL